jgi:thiol-disulfide isomerase/thioredoxin
MSKSTTEVTPRQRQGGSPRSRWRLWLSAAGVATVIVLVVVATQRGGDVPEQSSVAGSSDTGALKPTEQIQLSAAGGSEVGDPAPQFVATTTTGGRFQFSPGKPAVVFFMAPTCYSCLAEVQAVARVHAEYGGRLEVLGVDIDPQATAAQIQQFAQAARAKYGFTVDRDATLVKAFDARALDTTVITDAQGRIVFRDAVPTDEKTLREALKKAGL